jgi:hypothetical protein
MQLDQNAPSFAASGSASFPAAASSRIARSRSRFRSSICEKVPQRERSAGISVRASQPPHAKR